MNKVSILILLLLFSLLGHAEEIDVSAPEQLSAENSTAEVEIARDEAIKATEEEVIALEEKDLTKTAKTGSFEISKVADSIKPLSTVLGSTPNEAFTNFGLPIKISSVKSENRIEILTQQPDGYYFFWENNRVWQIGFPKTYTKTFFSIKIGSTIKDVEKVFGQAYKKDKNTTYYRLNSNVFPIFARIVFNEKGVVEAYIYRADI